MIQNPSPGAVGSKSGNRQTIKSFDYSVFDKDIAREARSVAKRYRKRTETYVIDTGRDLLRMKDRIKHGLFQEWARDALGIEPRMAQNFMSAAERFGDRREIVSRLPPSVIYSLASPSTPEPVRTTMLRRVEDGEVLQAKPALSEIRKARVEARVADKAEREKKRRAKLTAEQRAEEDKQTLEHEKEAQIEDDIEDQEWDAAAASIVEAIGADQLLKLEQKYGWSIFRIFNRARQIACAQYGARSPTIKISADSVRQDAWTWSQYSRPREMNRIVRIADAIREGVMIPVITVKCYKDGKYDVVDGHKFFLALVNVLKNTVIDVHVISSIDVA